MDSPLLAATRGGREGPSPGIASLKEAFDITYAVHRMEEEGARRRAYNGPGGAGQRGFLGGLNEDDEDEDDEEEGNGGAARESSKMPPPKDGPAHHDSIMGGRAGPRDQGKGRVVNATSQTATAGRTARTRGGNRGFDLDMGNATLLERRQKQKRVGNGTAVGYNGHPLAGKPMTAEDGLRMSEVSIPPGSPMHI